jgi:GNAT superfamily N-acetyltransferase
VSDIRVRLARPDEAGLLADMANDLNEHVGIDGRPFTAEIVRADGFGPQPAFTALVAELDGALAGYTFHSVSYNTDVAARSMWLQDLFVRPAARGRGVGHALMAAVAAETVRVGGASLEWNVHLGNVEALKFYRRLGASTFDVCVMSVAGDRLRALAGTASGLRDSP